MPITKVRQIMSNGERRENLQVVDTSDKITAEEIKEFKQMVEFWHAGKIVVIATVALGALAVALTHIWDFIAKLIER